MARWAGVHLAVIISVLKCAHFDLCEATESINMRGCGQSERLDRISDGYPVKRNQIPWIVLLDIVVSHESGFLSDVYCGGSIITKTVVLTAAHCFFNDEDRKFPVNHVEVFYNNTDGTEIWIKFADRVIIHPEYTSFRNGYDIALLHMAEPFHVDEFVRPVCLPNFGIRMTNKQVVAAGWSLDHSKGDPPYQLNYVFLRALSTGECFARLYDEGLEKLVPYMLICALTPGRDLCKGASGGPLTRRRGRRWFQVGITSPRQYCHEDVEKPIVYTRVSAFIDWITHRLNHAELWTELLSAR